MKRTKVTRATKEHAPAFRCTKCEARPASRYEAKQHAARTGHRVTEAKA